MSSSAASANQPPVSKSTMIIAAALALLISLAILFVFVMVLKALMRLKRAGQSMSSLDLAQLKTMMGNDIDAQAIKENADSLWINLTLIGLVVAYGIGSVLGAASSVYTLYNALRM